MSRRIRTTSRPRRTGSSSRTREKADEVARDQPPRGEQEGRRARRQAAHAGSTAINEAGLTPFAKEELDIVERRLGDVEHMVGDGDLAEALGMARQAKPSLDTIAGELEAALNDDPKSKWADATQDALDGVARVAGREGADRRAAGAVAAPRSDHVGRRPARARSAAPPPGDEQGAHEEARRSHEAARRRAARRHAAELGKKLGTAIDQMGMADDRMKGRDPVGRARGRPAPPPTRSRRRAIARAAPRARRRQSSVNDEPIRIPGADEYRAPEQFREELLEAMKKKGAAARGLRRHDQALLRGAHQMRARSLARRLLALARASHRASRGAIARSRAT